MKRSRRSGDVDPRLHQELDGELPPSKTAAFEGDLRSGTTLRNQQKALHHVEAWCQATRLRAPSSLARTVERVLEVERAAPDRADSWRPSRGRRPFGGMSLRWILIPAAAAAAAIALSLAIPQGRNGHRPGGFSPPPGRGVLASDRSPGAANPSTYVAEAQNPEHSTRAGTVRYVFRFRASAAGQVCLAGDFNDWKVCQAPLRHVGEDLWTISLDLPRGRYEYMYVVDGHWMTDPDAVAHADDGFGHRNAVLLL